MKQIINKDGIVIGANFDGDSETDLVRFAEELRATDWTTSFVQADLLRAAMRDETTFEHISTCAGFKNTVSALNHSRLSWFRRDQRRPDVSTRFYHACCGLGSTPEEKVEFSRAMFDHAEKRGKLGNDEWVNKVKKRAKKLYGKEASREDIDTTAISYDVFKYEFDIPVGDEDKTVKALWHLFNAMQEHYSGMEHNEGDIINIAMESVLTKFTPVE